MNLKTVQNFFLMMMIEFWNQPNPFISGFYDPHISQITLYYDAFGKTILDAGLPVPYL